ncbi:MAG TPA: PAS domain-containing protein [Rhodocyclaceae bacterium]
MKRLHRNAGTILIVDDIPANLGVMVDSLEHYGHRVVVAQDGQEGLLRASIVKPDVILLDVMMPGIDGFEVCRRLKADPETRDIPVIFMTALSDTADKIIGFTAGGSDYITKPFHLDEALARVGTQLTLRTMQRQLEAQNAELQRYRDSLEQQVEERTAQLFASEQAFRALAENSPDYIARYDRGCRRMYLNPAIKKMVGHSQLGVAPDAHSPLVDIPGYAAQLRHVLETGMPSAAEVQFRNQDGEARWGHMRVVPELGADGKVASVLAVCRDVHELKESEQRFRTLADNLPDVIIRYGADGRKLYVNDAMRKLLGIDGDAMLGETAAETAVVIDVDAYDRALRETVAGGEPHEIEVAVRDAVHRGERIYNVRFCAERDPQGAIIGALMLARDITERKRMEASIDKERATLRAFFNALPDLAWMKDAEGRYLACNPLFERFFGAAEAAIVGKTDFDFVDAELAAFFREKDRAAETAGGPTANEEWITFADDGHRALLETIKAPVKDARGNIIGVIGLGHDITERKGAEAELRQAYRLLQDLMTRRETVREEERKRVAREIHDELGQHLTALRMGISTLRFQFGRELPALGERVQELIGLSDRTIQVVRDVAAALRPAVLDSGLGPALEWLVAQFQERSGIACELAVPADWPGMDEERAMALFRIAQESLTNVARHAKTPWASVRLSVEDGCAVARIQDAGQGFAAAGASGKTFGLMGMRERALMLGGEVLVDSRPGEGTIVTATIPLYATREAP